ncbi:MAG: hypothetical protein AAF800_10600 [Planctomycetota bacterium]
MRPDPASLSDRPRRRRRGWWAVLLPAAVLAGVSQYAGPRLAAAQDGEPDPTAAADSEAPASARPSVRVAIGYDDARLRLGRGMPTGAGVAFAHVEGQPGRYAPDLQGPAYEGVAFSLRSGPSEPFAHATSTARVIYGSTGLAPGVEVVHCMTSAGFLGPLHLNAGTTAPPVTLADTKTPFPPRVFSHSWIGSPPDDQAAVVLRRVDHQIDTRELVMCVGVNNGRHTPVPPLLASAYNVIAVGTADGNNSGGVTSLDVPGRVKPDLVAPWGPTSFTTPVAAAVAGLLVEQADRLADAGHPTAGRSEVIKAALLGGATKPDAWDASPDNQPLDRHLGAGMVNVDRALRILAAAPLTPGDTFKRLFGWSAPTVERGQTLSYSLELPGDTGPASFTLVWNRRIDGRVAVGTRRDTGQRVGVWLDAPRVADLDLRLVALADDGTESVLARSVSRVDNVEHVHLPSLTQGTYRLEIVRDADHDPLDEPWDAALTWAIDKPQ